jgi:ribosomal protein L14E/L6E/L27E
MSSKETKKKPIMKAGKVVIILAGRHAGQKAIIVKTFEEGDRKRTFGHALVCGVEKAPQTVTKSMGKKKIEERSKVCCWRQFLSTGVVVRGWA